MTEEPDPTVGMTAAGGSPNPVSAGVEQAIPPFKVLFVSDLLPGKKTDDWTAGEHVAAVDKSSFARFMADSSDGASITFDVLNKITSSPRSLEVTVSVSSLNDFKPGNLALRVPVLSRLLSVRHLLIEAGQGRLEADGFKDGLKSVGVDEDYAAELYKTLFSPSDSGSARDDGGPSSVDRLLAMVDVRSAGDGVASSDNPLLSKLMDAVAGDVADTGVDAREAKKLIDDIDGIVGSQVKETVLNPDFRALESSWRGLKFLVDRLDFRSGLQLETLACDRESLSEALYHQVLMREFSDNPPEVPISLVVLDFSFSQALEDVEFLNDFATTAASMQAPIVACLSPKFFGKDSDGELTALPLVWQHMEGPDFIKWNKLRDMKESQYLCLALPNFLLRSAHSAGGSSGVVRIEEEEGLWGRASLVVAVGVAASYAATGWPTAPGDYSIDDLPIGGSPRGGSPLAVLIPDGKIGELAKAGFTVLTAKANSDAVRVARANTMIKPKPSDDLVKRTSEKVHATLPARLFIARAAHFLLGLQRTIPSGDSPATTLKTITGALRSLMRARGQTAPQESVSVEHVPDAKLPDDELWAIRLRSHRGILPKEVSAVMGLTTKGKYTAPEEPQA